MPSDPQQPTPVESRPYPPSFLDRFMDSVERLPLPYWLTYLALFALQSALMHILAWIDGWLPAWRFNPIILLFPLWQWLPFAIMTYLDSAALQALSIFSPLLAVDGTELKRLKLEFSTMPSRGVVLSGVGWGIVYVILTLVYLKAFYVSYGVDAFVSAVTMLEGLVTYLTGSAIYYHSLRMLILINRTVKRVAHFNMFQLDPVYAFSRVTSQVGVAWMLMLSLTLLLFPVGLVGGLTLSILILQVLLAAAAFVLPLWFVHRRLVSEKLKLLAGFNRQVELTSARLHRSLEDNDLAPVTALKDALLGLTAEHEILKSLPTWPWRSGTLSGFLSATVLPIALFLVQFAIQKLLGK
ncbi:MAG TPA: hypothetical protein VIV15_02320 [Anaerolineales bacterium]